MSKRKFSLIGQWFELLRHPLDSEDTEPLFAQLTEASAGCFVVKAFYYMSGTNTAGRFYHHTRTVGAAQLHNRQWFSTFEELACYLRQVSERHFGPEARKDFLTALDYETDLRKTPANSAVAEGVR